MDGNASESVGIIASGRAVTSKRRQNLVTIGLPFVVAVLGVVSGVGMTWTTASVFAICFLLGGVGIGIGLHRYFSHRAFQARPALRLALGVLASWAWQGPLCQWVADHRRHHRFADTPLDPHSPHWVAGEPARTSLGGLLHAHLGWMLAGDVSDPGRYAVDVGQDPISSGCSRFYWPLALSSLLLPGVAGYWLGGPAEALRCTVWAGAVRVVLLQHTTWAIASVGHRYGAKVADSKDESRNSVVLAILLFGEGLHSFHHVHPGAGVNEPAGLDLNGWILKGWERWGWITQLKRAT